jgi:hypothetical protein
LIGTPEGGDGAFLDAPVIVAKGLDELDVAAWSGGGPEVVTLTYMPPLYQKYLVGPAKFNSQKPPCTV